MRSEDREAFDAFVRARLPELLRFGRALTGSPEAGADLVQDALERTLLAWHRIDSRADPEGYVRRIMVNRNISVWRKLRRERVTAEVDERGVEDRHFDGDLWKALQQLPPRQRAVIALRYYEDLSEADIARTLARSARSRARRRRRLPSFASWCPDMREPAGRISLAGAPSSHPGGG